MHAVKSYLDRQKDLYFNMEEYIGKINSLKVKKKKSNISFIHVSFQKRQTETSSS